MEENIVTLFHGDTYERIVSKKAIMIMSKLIYNIIESDPEVQRIELLSIENVEVLDWILNYVNYHYDKQQIKKIECPIKSFDMKFLCAECPWNFTFLESKTDIDLAYLILAADYLAIDSLMNLVGAQITILAPDDYSLQTFNETCTKKHTQKK